MHPAEIQAALKKKGIKQADIARMCEVSAAAVGEVIHGKSRSRNIESRIAQELGISEAELWPDWYVSGGVERWAKEVGFHTPDEALLLRSYRALPADEKQRVLAFAQSREAGVAFDMARPAASTTVTASGAGSKAAGRDINEAGKKSRKGR